MSVGLSRGKRAQHARVVTALGAHRVIPIAKDDVIAYLIATDWKPAARELLYRDWCEVVGVDCSRTDIARVRGGRRRELNRGFNFDRPDDGEGEPNQTVAATAEQSAVARHGQVGGPRDRRGKGAVTASTSGD
jgi:hypothetical protein